MKNVREQRKRVRNKKKKRRRSLESYTEVSDCSRRTNLCDLGSMYSSDIWMYGIFFVVTTRLKSPHLSTKMEPSFRPLVTDASLISVHWRASQWSRLYCRVGPGAR